MSDILISAENLLAGYGAPVVTAAELAVKSGEILVLIGPNGGGKSTLLRTLAGELKKLGGKVALCGIDMDSLPPKERAKKLSVLLTDRPRAGKMTCREVAETGRYPYTGYFGLLSEADKRAVDRAMELVGVAELARLDFSQVSDGQRQRVMLARAICQEPEVMILDEPTSYLDIRHKLIFLDSLQRLAKENSVAVIMSMHELDLAEIIAGRVLCVKDGRIFRAGTPDEIFKEEVLRELFDLPDELYKKYFMKGK